MTKLEEIFNSFTLKEERTHRPQLKQCFEKNGYACATNGYIFIRAKMENIDFEIKQNDIQLNCEKIFPKITQNKIFNFDLNLLEKYKTEDECKYSYDECKCTECDGTGEVEWMYEGFLKDGDCPVCEGDGYDRKKSEITTGNKTFPKMVAKIGESFFEFMYIHKIMIASEYLGESIYLKNSIAEFTPAFFTCSFCDFLVANLRHVKDGDKIITLEDFGVVE